MKPVLKIAKSVSFGMDMSEVRIDSNTSSTNILFTRFTVFTIL